MEQEIRFCTAANGARIAYATAGPGPPLVKAANYLTHLEHDWRSPVWRHWMTELARHHTLVRYDERGCGLSDWDVEEFSLEAWVQDLEAVVDALGLDRFPLLGISQGAAVSVAYAVRHPEKVSHLILYGGYARGRFHRDLSREEITEAETLINVIRVGWGQENPAFRQLFTTMLMPEGTDEQIRWLNELARVSTRPENAATMERAFYHIDVREMARRVATPTLVLHGRDDAAIPFEEGRLLAGLIPEARFVPLQSKNHILLPDEPAWARFLAEVRSFLGVIGPEREAAATGQLFPELTGREREVLELMAQGFSNSEIADALVITPKTARNYVARIYRKLEVDHRARAIVLAREAGLGRSSL
ncbi:MAG TPA: alpha/beta fold hydrolase [Candidatus Sulfomarinibacteraceae bacterium]|nr:alpha/beta fold hydrolase [Candidatus Sulfomarinibacteraceae bacterium]